MALAINRETRPVLEHARAGPAEDLAAGHGVAPNHRRDLLEREIERIAQHEYHALQRGKALEHGQQGEGNVFGTHAGLILGRKRFGQPLADIGFAPRPLIAQPIEAEPGRNGCEISLEGAHRIPGRGIVKADKRVLDDLLGIGPIAGDSIGEGEQGWTQLGEGAIERHAGWPVDAVSARLPLLCLLP